MTATTDAQTTSQPASHARSTGLMGFTAFFRKEVAQWVGSRRGPIVFGATTVLATLIALANGLEPASAAAGADATMAATQSVLGVEWGVLLVIIGVIATMDLLAIERERGTLAWSLSKPLSRNALLLAKWSAGTLMYATFGLVLPIIVSVWLATVLHGAVPDLGVVAIATAVWVTIPIFYVGLALALGTRLSSQAAIAGIAFGLSAVPLFASSIVPEVGAVVPSAMGDWGAAFATGADPSWLTPIGWLIFTAIAVLAAPLALARADL
jgi:ABC-2 type transport system permease protein